MSYLLALQNLPYRAGSQAIGNLSTTQAVTFTSAMPNANYTVVLSFDSTLASATSASAITKTASGFTITLMDYIAWLNN